MSQRNVEIVIGRLVSDEALRARFQRRPRATIARLREAGLELNSVEATALESLAAASLEALAGTLDPRLQRASLIPRARKRRAALVGLLVSLAARSVSAETLSLDDAVARALAANPRVHEAELRVTSAKHALAEARTQALPSLSVEALGGRTLSSASTTIKAGALGEYPGTGPLPATDTELESSRGASAYVSASLAQPLTQIYAAQLGVRASRTNLAIEREKLHAERLAVAHEARRAYYGVLQTESALAAALQRAELLRETDRLVGDYVVREVALRSESLEARAAVAAQEARVRSLRNALASYKEQLNGLLGRDLSEALEVVPIAEAPPSTEALAAAQRRALVRRADTKQASLEARALATQLRRERAEAIPELSLVVSYSSHFGIEQLPQNVTQAGLHVRWEPFDWGRRARRVARARLDLEQARSRERALRSRVLLEVNAAFRALDEASFQLRAARLSREAAAERARVALNRQREHASLLQDALTATAELADADDQFQQTLLSYWTARADFERATGEK